MSIDIDKALSAAQKREISRAMAGYVESEVKALCNEEAKKIARQWVKINAEWIKGEVDAACAKAVKAAIRDMRIDIDSRW